MELHTWLLYLIAAIGLSITPGPNSLLAITHGALYGHQLTLFTIFGGALGFILLIALSMMGIGALLQTSAQALVILKWLGGAYLVWLGWQLWKSPALHLAALSTSQTQPNIQALQLFKNGFLAAISNPKALLFYGAFLPQFMSAHSSLLTQFIIMASTFAIVEILFEYFLARLAHKIRPWLNQTGKKFNRVCACLFAVMGVALPFTK
jgi:threonine/homoserine/homoserine lactone efflux protein